jgi:citrate lyase subunit beta/citryl-CoA lyase
MLGKLDALFADRLILDLEDGVAPSEKGSARENLLAMAAPERPFMLRINPPGSPWHEDDLALAAALKPATVVLPKAESPAEVAGLAAKFSTHGSSTALMIETAGGVGRVRELAAAAPDISMLIYGSADLRLSLGARPDPARTWERHAMGEILLAARMHRCAAIDAVYFHYKDRDGLVREAEIARSLGFDGKSCIHPGQIDPIHDVFSSTTEEITWARKILAAWEEQGGGSKAVIVVDGEMIEALHLQVAQRILKGRSTQA